MKRPGDVSFTRVSGVPVAEVRGELDLSNTGRIGAEIRREVVNADPGVIVDLSGVTYLDSSAIRLLFELEGQLRSRLQQLRVAVPQEAYIRTILEIARLEEKVPVHRAVGDAVAAFGGR